MRLKHITGKANFRDTKVTRDRVISWLENQQELKSGVIKNADLINAVCTKVAVAAGKKMTKGKYTITAADIKKLDTKDFTIENLTKSNYKKLFGKNGGGKPNSKVNLEEPEENTISLEDRIQLDTYEFNEIYEEGFNVYDKDGNSYAPVELSDDGGFNVDNGDEEIFMKMGTLYKFDKNGKRG